MDELRHIKSDSSFIPEGCLNFVDESTFIVGAIDEDFDELMESAGLLENNAPEVGDVEPSEDGKDATAKNESAEVVTEKFDAKAAGGKIVEFLKSVWAKIKAAFEKAINWINGRVADAKAKALDKLSAKWDKASFKAETKLGKFHKGNNIGDTKWMTSFTGKAVATDNYSAGGGEANVNLLPAKVLKSAGISVGNDVDIKRMRSALKDYFLGEEVEVTGTNIGSVKEDVFGIIKGSQTKDVKAAYNAARKVIDDLIKSVKSEKKDAADKDAKKAIAGRANVARRFGQTLATGVSVQLDCIRKQNSEAFGIAMRVKMHIDKKAKKGEEKTTGTSEAVDIFAW